MNIYLLYIYIIDVIKKFKFILKLIIKVDIRLYYNLNTRICVKQSVLCFVFEEN